MSKNNVTVIMVNGEKKRVTLAKPTWQGKKISGTGVTLNGIYVGIRSKRVVVETYSIWTKMDGSVEGTRYHEADGEEIIRLCTEYAVVALALENNGIIEVEEL